MTETGAGPRPRRRSPRAPLSRLRTLAMTLSTALAMALAIAAATTACGPRDRPLDDAGLEAMIDSLLPAIAEASGLAILRPVEHALQPRAEAEAFIGRQLAEQWDDMGGMEAAYRELGLLPDTLDLRGLLQDLYTEQVVGYYDPRTDRLYVVEGIAARDAAPVVAHELVHALQDQHMDLDSLVAPIRGNDRQMAAQAAAEGQAMVVMMALQAAETAGRPIDPGALPDLTELLHEAMAAEHAEFPVFARSPRIIREGLLFPYVHGAAFVQALYRMRPVGEDPPVPFGDLLPTSTQQVMNPVDRFIRARTEPLEIRLEEPAGGWASRYDDTLGQFELTILLTEFLGDGAADVASGWRGDRYALLEGPAGESALVWYSAWEDNAAADRFATRYRQLLERRPRHAGDVRREEHGGQPVVRVVQSADGVDPARIPVPAVRSMAERPDL
jgi:hypothetical protein